MKTLLDQFNAARLAGTPIVAISTPDQEAVLHDLAKPISHSHPIFRWDCVRGMVALNRLAHEVAARCSGSTPLSEQTMHIVDALALALASFPERTIVFVLNANAWVDAEPARANPAPVQAVANVRGAFSTSLRMLVLLGPSFALAPALQHDVVLLDDPLPTDEQLRDIVTRLHEAASLPAPSPDVLDRAVTRLRGLSHFAAEQVTAMSLPPEGFDLAMLGELQRRTVNQTPGLVMEGDDGPTFEQVGGLSQIRQFLGYIMSGSQPPALVVRIDEIEKMIAGAGAEGPGDSSGTSQYALGVLLRYMEDEGWGGLIAVGPPGSGKTLISRAMGRTYGVPTIALDLGATKASLVGESEQRINTALRVIRSIGRERVFFVATCNRLDALPPELRRRFRYGIWFFDLPSPEERAQIWALHLRAYGVPEDAPRPDDTDWTGAEIRNCCELAWRLGITPREAAQFIVPVAKAAPEAVERLRAQADGRFLDVGRPGVYRRAGEPAQLAAQANGDGLGRTVRRRLRDN